MTEKVSFVANYNLTILTYQGLKTELDDGAIPAKWLMFFARDEVDTEMPDYNRILYLRNVNIRPLADDGCMTPLLPIWHAAAVLFWDDKPISVILIRHTQILDDLVRDVAPAAMIATMFPELPPGGIRVDLIDAEEEPEPGEAILGNLPIEFLDGWPSEEDRQSYLRTKMTTERLAQEHGRKAVISVNYRLSLPEI